jgi:hypothetical protein
MPLLITRLKNNKYHVKNALTGEIHAKGTTNLNQREGRKPSKINTLIRVYEVKRQK